MYIWWAAKFRGWKNLPQLGSTSELWYDLQESNIQLRNSWKSTRRTMVSMISSQVFSEGNHGSPSYPLDIPHLSHIYPIVIPYIYIIYTNNLYVCMYVCMYVYIYILYIILYIYILYILYILYIYILYIYIILYILYCILLYYIILYYIILYDS